MMGAERKSMVMTDEEKKATAYHEAGHALVSLHVDGCDPLHKVTIIPRGRALGVTWNLPERDRYSMSMKQMKARLALCFGGRIAEQLIYGLDELNTGASNDIQQATDMARAMEELINQCSDSKVLEFVDTPLAEASTRMPPMTTALLQRHGDAWTHALSINDLTFDFMAPSLAAAGIDGDGPPANISAGDGSEVAFQRIRQGEQGLRHGEEELLPCHRAPPETLIARSMISRSMSRIGMRRRRLARGSRSSKRGPRSGRAGIIARLCRSIRARRRMSRAASTRTAPMTRPWCSTRSKAVATRGPAASHCRSGSPDGRAVVSMRRGRCGRFFRRIRCRGSDR